MKSKKLFRNNLLTLLLCLSILTLSLPNITNIGTAPDIDTIAPLSDLPATPIQS